MFFRRKPAPSGPKSRPEAPSPGNGRRQYRQQQLWRERIGFRLRDEVGAEFEGEFLDASISGAAALFTLAGDPGLSVGDAVELSLSCDSQEADIVTPARVVYVEPGDDQHWRYAFEFVSVGNLYAQLDEFYARIFNRRESRRILVPPEQAVRARLMWGANTLDCRVHDLSAGGMSTLLTDEKAQRIAEVERLRVRLRLPGCGEPLLGPATLRHREELAGHVLIGIEFDLEREDGMRRHHEALGEFVEARRRAIERWERAIGAA